MLVGPACIVWNRNLPRRKVGGSSAAGTHDLPQGQAPVVGKIPSVRIISEEPGSSERNILRDDDNVSPQLSASERRISPENIFQTLFERTGRITVPETLQEKDFGEDRLSKLEVEVSKVGRL